MVALLVQLLLGHHTQADAHVLGQNVQIKVHIFVLEAGVLLANFVFREDFEGLLAWDFRQIVLHDFVSLFLLLPDKL